MQNVLIVASHIPPYHQGQVMRVAKLVKYLPEFGWDSIIISAKAETGMEHITDLTADISKAKRIYRTHYVNLVKLYHSVRGKFSRQKTTQTAGGSVAHGGSGVSLAAQYLIPDYYCTWIPVAILNGVTALLTQKVHAILSMSPLPSNLLVGYFLHCVSGKPWVIDLRDPWTTNPIRTERAHPYLGKLDLLLERKVLKRATKIVVINKQFIPPLLKQHPMLNEEKFVVVPNGYDPDDFKGVERVSFDKFTIVHSGKFYGDRSPENFFQGLKLLLIEHPELTQRIQVKFPGGADQRTRSLVRDLGIEDIVELIDFVPHKVSLQYIMSADCLLLIPGPGESTATGKIFEYLASGKPILALTGKGAANEIIAATNSGVCVSPYEVHDIAKGILRFYECFTNGTTPFHPGDFEASARAQYDRREIARTVALLLRDLTASK